MINYLILNKSNLIKLIILILVFFIFSFCFNPAMAQEPAKSLRTGQTLIQAEGEGGAWGTIVSWAFFGQANASTSETLEGKIGAVIGAALMFVGALFIILIIYGGVLWMTAGGNEEQVKKARKYIINATIGLIIVVLANVITAFVLNLVQPGTGATPAP